MLTVACLDFMAINSSIEEGYPPVSETNVLFSREFILCPISSASFLHFSVSASSSPKVWMRGLKIPCCTLNLINMVKRFKNSFQRYIIHPYKLGEPRAQTKYFDSPERYLQTMEVVPFRSGKGLKIRIKNAVRRKIA
ncbi:unnamed protein product [Ilex paraguariensis]|uniref:Uncharacterized protein n=1 Tax=Ilex paraguariensis TaxID=185542 RepID=A0ABC8TD82_9AQUA